MSKYLPFIVTAIVVLPMVGYQWFLMEWVWGANTQSQQCAYLIMKPDIGVPYTLGEEGEWEGTDLPVEKKVLEVAGAEGYIQRRYVNKNTNQFVDVWFIVGNFRQVSKHTPNACYVYAGFKELEKPHRFDKFDVSPKPEFFTSKFGRTNPQGFDEYQRVFWAWWKPEVLEEGQSPEDVEVKWTAPDNARTEFGPCRALYKLYFTAASDASESDERSACVDFANIFLPEVEKVLKQSGRVMAEDELPADLEEVTEPLTQDDAKEAGLPEAHQETEGLVDPTGDDTVREEEAEEAAAL
jgi:hypothetical protein